MQSQALLSARWQSASASSCPTPCLFTASGDGSDRRMPEVIWIDGGARNPKVPTVFQVADVETGVINWVNSAIVTDKITRL